MRLLALAGDIQAVIAQIRLVTPLAVLCQRQGWSLVLKSFHDCTHADLSSADVLVVQRAASSRVLRIQQRMRDQGGAVVFDIDDLLTEVAPHISNQDAVRRRVRDLTRCLAAADIVTVSTPRLGQELGMDRPHVVPNCAFPAPEMDLPAPRTGEPVTLLFASSDHLATDFIYPALRGLEGVQVAVVGPPAAAFEREGIAVRAYPLMARERFIALARELPNAVAVIPLESSRFAACKSAVKWFDYAMAGVPTLCSAVSPYLEVVDDGVTGALVANDVQSWRSALSHAVADGAWRKRITVAAQAQVREHHGLQHTVQAWHGAVLAALQAAESRPRSAPGLAKQVQNAVALAADRLAQRLRALNRARLARRARR